MSYEPDEEGWSAARWLGAYASAMYNEYLDYWELQNVGKDSQFSEAQRSHFRALKEIADTLTPCLHSLSVGPEVIDKIKRWLEEIGATKVASELSSDTAAKLTRAIYAHQIIRDGITIDLALQAADDLLAGAEKRAATLIDLVANRNLSERAAAFLDRATRLYLWGFEPESVVMCASVLEAAYEQRFPSQEMFGLQIRKKGGQFEPYQYEHAAWASKVFTPQEKKLAYLIRTARNDTLHNAPNVALGAEQALHGTATLLGKLYPS